MTGPLTEHLPGERAHTLSEWQAAGGYAALAAARETDRATLTARVADAGLRGRGGAGFPTGKKWGFMPGPEAAPAYLCVNADEMESCTFKDRLLLERGPHQLIEGALIAAHAMGVSEIVVVIRDAYRPGTAALRHALEEAGEAGLLDGAPPVHLHPSAGRYIVGEESALLEAVEGRRAIPRQRPPYPAQSGLWGRPTTVNNVETLSCLPHIVRHGPDWFRGLSRTDNGGTKLFGVSGRVRRPGLFERPLGTTARELIDAAGGMAGDGRLLAFQPGGGASAFLTVDHLDLPLDFDTVAEAGSDFGTGMLIVLDGTACPVATAARHARFYARESCGWCTPCREGLPWARRILEALETGEARPGDLDILRMHVDLGGQAFCGLMEGGLQCVASLFTRFPALVQAHLDGGCPMRAA